MNSQKRRLCSRGRAASRLPVVLWVLVPGPTCSPPSELWLGEHGDQEHEVPTGRGAGGVTACRLSPAPWLPPSVSNGPAAREEAEGSAVSAASQEGEGPGLRFTGMTSPGALGLNAHPVASQACAGADPTDRRTPHSSSRRADLLRERRFRFRDLSPPPRCLCRPRSPLCLRAAVDGGRDVTVHSALARTALARVRMVTAVG